MMNKEQEYHIATLGNGLRVVAQKLEGQVSYIGIVVRAGSRNEDSEHEGLAHFVEHTLFKGTRRRKSRHISCRMEEIGGELNAYTTKEETMIYTNAPAGHTERAVELIADLVKNSNFPLEEIEKERDVIIEEIHSYEDSPSESVYDEFEELIYKGSPLAHNILGSPDSVRRLTPEDARGFIDRHYTPKEMVVYCCDPGDPEKNIRLVEKYLGDLSFPSILRDDVPIPPPEAFNEVRERDAHQANTIVGTRLFSRNDPRRHAMFLLNNWLGGPCMNSRLNMELREKRGLVYTVESNVSLLSDAGTMTIYFATDPKAVDKCLRIIHKEIEKAATSLMTDRQFARIRNQYLGQLIVGTDQRESRCMALAKSLLYFGRINDISWASERIRAVSPEDFREMARLILDSGLNRLTLI
ncbi:MAG: insulinase family protein [Muribaculaceae bacterium]|nr:insulinase family protein [Muribaculaceae bacterium]